VKTMMLGLGKTRERAEREQVRSMVLSVQFGNRIGPVQICHKENEVFPNKGRRMKLSRTGGGTSFPEQGEEHDLPLARENLKILPPCSGKLKSPCHILY
jgi:hypothetical protein